MGIGDIRYTVLQVVNEVQRKLGLSTTTTLTFNKLATQLVDFVNDTCNDLSDYGNWQETLVSSNVTAVANQMDYSINTSANVKNIGDIYFSTRTGPMRHIPVDQMRLLTRVTATGTPTQFTIYGTDANGNPNIRVRPIPTSAEAGSLFSILWYQRAPSYSTADVSAVVPFPGDLVVEGTLARAILNESGGSPTDKYSMIQRQYEEGTKEAFNRFNADTGWTVSFSPNRRGRR